MSPISNNINLNDNTLSLAQKLIVMFLACLLFLSMIPVGLVPDTNEPKEVGEFVKFYPSSEFYSDDNKLDGIKKIGSGFGAYYTFNLKQLAETDLDDIRSVRLRLTFLKGSGSLGNKIIVTAGEPNLTGNPVAVNTPFPFESTLATIYPQTLGHENSLSEVDVTEYAKELLANGKSEFSVRLSGNMTACVNIATAENNDPAYRPHLKAVTGDAVDTDAPTLAKATLGDAVYVSSEQGSRTGLDLTLSENKLLAGSGNEIYLRFNINEAAISGSVYSAFLSLNKLDAEGCDIKIFCINNNEWSADTISYDNRPRGDENAVYSLTPASADSDGRINFDITQAVCEARSLGIASLTFRITGTDTITAFSSGESPKLTPQLYLKASDDKDIVCTSEAALAALGNNHASFVTMGLLDSYSVSNGADAKIRWSEYKHNGDNLQNYHIAENGDITRPKWFEGDAKVLAVAEIHSGRYTTKRIYNIKIPAETPPDYSRYKFGNYIDIGTGQTEKEQKFEYINTSGAKRRWTSGRMFTYRTPEKDGVMVLNFSCIPDSNNYITLKLWEGDSSLYNGFVLSVCDDSSKSIVLEPPTQSTSSDNGFVYATYALPRSFTDNKTQISLRLSYAEYQDGEFEPRGIYAAYLTQNPFFEPKQFSKQGEKSISEPLFGESAISKFIDNLRNLSAPLNFTNNNANVPQTNQAVSIDEESGTIVFAGEEANIAFSIDNDNAVIYQRLEYYDKYCSGCPVTNENEVTTIDYGDYKLIWNRSKAEVKPVPYRNMYLSGAYKEILGGNYFTFSEEWQMTDDSAIPETATILDGKQLTIPPGGVMLLVCIAEPVYEADWRVSKINGKNASELTLNNNEKITSVTVKSIGGMPESSDTVTAIFAVYEDEKLVSLSEQSTPIVASTNIYTIDFSDFDISVKKGMIIRIFVFDDSQSLTQIAPKLDLP